MTRPEPIGSYSPEDVVFLLKDISQSMGESGTEEREKAIQAGIHYSEMLPQEYKPSDEYMRIFHSSLHDSAEKLAVAVGVVAERIIENKGQNLVLVSLARAGTPIGILIKRYLEYAYNLWLPHYSISIIRGKGIDEHAIRYILQQHPGQSLQFIDGWTGKGAITKELQAACDSFAGKYSVHLPGEPAVVADPGHCVSLYGTREDFLIPSACLNSTVSGLVSRTVHRDDVVGEFDYHGAKFYTELKEEDVSYLFIETIAGLYPYIIEKVQQKKRNDVSTPPAWKGMREVAEIARRFSIDSMHRIKPGVGETTRVLLRRVPWKILIHPAYRENLKHVLLLAEDRGVPVEVYPDMSYSCCGLIKRMGRED
ncbi:cysteine protease StiP family protein [Aneurinibacillus terranovensis]|uniref:cysteine protease StiP family protein n=1 Tax=Aneurinibacillus terranovensis TaxID=278991 RepID=UPI0004821800|nr:cysteine protease StiP family protein [Aneurinibacillus terranovensis]